MSEQRAGEGGGCAAVVVFVLVLGAVFAVAISLAALVDPFAWMPPVGEVWADCADDPATHADDCDLATRFPGFWVHVLANLAYALVACGLLLALAGTVGDLRRRRPERFDSETAAARYADARRDVALCAVFSGLLAALPIVVALL